jgi:hypothetical protein
MSGIADKVKEKVKDAKDKVVGTAKEGKEGVSSTKNEQGTEVGRKDDPLTEYRAKEAMTPAKEKEHEPTAVSRDPSSQKIVEPGQVGTNPEEAAERARRSGMTKGTAGAEEAAESNT